MADSFWSFGSEVPEARGAETAPARAPDWGIGQRVGGRYVVRGLLGRGAHATVFRGWDVETQREVALKALAAVDPAARTRLLREARILARLRHPALLKIHDAVVHDDRPVLVLELVEGPTLEARLGQLDRSVGLELLEQVAQALGEAHRQGVVHRDVKANNVLLAEDGPRVADFGLARSLEAGALTQTGALVGTPTSMAPEQLAGRREVGPPADVWALGVLLFRLLSGQLPFLGSTLLEQAELVQRGAPSLRDLGVEVPPELEAVCQRALDPDPARRFPDGEAFAGALALARTSGLTAPRRPSVWSVWALGAGALLIVAAVGVGAARWGQARWRQAPPPTPAAPTAEVTPLADAPVWRRRAMDALGRDDLQAASEYVEQAVLEYDGFEDYTARALLRLRLGEFEGAREDCRRALDREASATLRARFNLGPLLLDLREYELALALAERLVEEAGETAETLWLRAMSRDKLGQPGAEADLSRALELEPGDAWCLCHRGILRLKEGRLDEALADLERVRPGADLVEVWESALQETRRRIEARRRSEGSR